MTDQPEPPSVPEPAVSGVPAEAAPAGAQGDGAGPEALQAAALQLIHAARSFLDASERLVKDPQALQQVAGTVTGLARVALDALRPRSPDAPRDAASPPAPERIVLRDDAPPPGGGGGGGTFDPGGTSADPPTIEPE